MSDYFDVVDFGFVSDALIQTLSLNGVGSLFRDYYNNNSETRQFIEINNTKYAYLEYGVGVKNISGKFIDVFGALDYLFRALIKHKEDNKPCGVVWRELPDFSKQGDDYKIKMRCAVVPYDVNKLTKAIKFVSTEDSLCENQ